MNPKTALRSLVLSTAAALLIALVSTPAQASTNADQKARLAAQHHLDYDVPLIESTWIGTHNSFNNADDGYIIPNQDRDMIDQLNAGFRVLSYDLHYEWFEFRLCHAVRWQGVNYFCGPGDTLLRDALNDLKDWLRDHPNEVVMIVIQDVLGDEIQHQDAGDIIRSTISDYNYEPWFVTDNSSGWCQSLPIETVTKADVLAAGKQLIIATPNDCGWQGNAWRKRVWNLPSDAHTGSYNSTTLKTDKMVFAVEDRAYGDDSDKLTGSEIQTALTNGANVIGLDFGITTNRHDYEIWSWKTGEPNTAQGYCALQTTNTSDTGFSNQWVTSPCWKKYPYACQSWVDGSWAISTEIDNYHYGNTACKNLGVEYSFSAPTNAWMNEKLAAAKAAAGYTEVYVDAVYRPMPFRGMDWKLDTIDRTEWWKGSKVMAAWNPFYCLNVVGENSSTNYSTINLSECSSVLETWWLDSGTGKIRAAWDRSMCLNVVGDNTSTDNATVNLYQCSGVTETWEQGPDLKIRAAWDPSMCLNVVGTNSTTNGSAVNLYRCDGVTEMWSYLTIH